MSRNYKRYIYCVNRCVDLTQEERFFEVLAFHRVLSAEAAKVTHSQLQLEMDCYSVFLRSKLFLKHYGAILDRPVYNKYGATIVEYLLSPSTELKATYLTDLALFAYPTTYAHILSMLPPHPGTAFNMFLHLSDVNPRSILEATSSFGAMAAPWDHRPHLLRHSSMMMIMEHFKISYLPISTFFLTMKFTEADREDDAESARKQLLQHNQEFRQMTGRKH